MSEMTTRKPQASATAMPKWLVYGIVAKIIIVIAITAAVLFYAGIL